MNVYFPKDATKVLEQRMAFIKGRGAKILAEGIAKEIEAGNLSDRTAGVDRYGKPYTPLRSKRKGYYRGATGPPLAPFYFASRVVSHFKAQARRTGGQWRITAGWAGVVSSKGVPFLFAHDMGAGRLPRRAIFGLSPRTWGQVRALVDKFKRKGGRS